MKENSRLLFLTGVLALATCSLKSAVPEGVLRLSIDEFNAHEKGWRVLEAEKDFEAAGELIEAYVAKHASALSEDALTLLHFHAVQMFAFSGDTARALRHIPQSKYEQEAPDWPLRWNDYVDATEAFLRRDRASLLAARTRILAGPKSDGEPPNLYVVDSLIEHFDTSYYSAYSQGKRRPNKAVPFR